VQVLTKACIWGNNLYQAGKGKILEQARTATASFATATLHLPQCRCETPTGLHCVDMLLSVQEYIDVSRRRLGRPTLDLLQFYWHDYSIKNYVDAALRLTDMQVWMHYTSAWQVFASRLQCTQHGMCALSACPTDMQVPVLPITAHHRRNAVPPSWWFLCCLVTLPLSLFCAPLRRMG